MLLELILNEIIENKLKLVLMLNMVEKSLILIKNKTTLVIPNKKIR